MDGIKRVAQACDACKLRKVKCNGQQRCQQCSHLDLRCVYPTKQKQRSSLKRGRLISQYKEQTSSAARASNVPLKLAPATGSQEASPPVIRAESVTSGLVSPVASTPDSVLPVSSSDNIWLKREPSKFSGNPQLRTIIFRSSSAEGTLRTLQLLSKSPCKSHHALQRNPRQVRDRQRGLEYNRQPRDSSVSDGFRHATPN